MKYFLYIDESGPFDERLTGGASSVVGGVCTHLSHADWVDVHQHYLDDWCKVRDQDCVLSYPSHFHCGPLLGRQLSLPSNLSDKDLRDFTEGVFQNALNNSLFGFISKNRGKRFEYSPQATYVMNLVASLRHAFEQLAKIDPNAPIPVVVYIAQRTIAETIKVKTADKYVESLFNYVADQLTLGDGPGVHLAKALLRNNALSIQSGVGDRDAGLISADFICCLSRQRIKPKGVIPLYVCNPDPEMLLGDYREFHDRQANELLKCHYYGNYLEFVSRYYPMRKGVPDITALLEALESGADAAILERELPALLAVVHMLAKNRTEGPHMLSCASFAADKLSAIANRQIEKDLSGSMKRVWLNFYIQALSELSACLNHTGEVGPQREIEERLSKVLNAHKIAIGKGALERQTILLDVRNRNLNLLFNDYCFEDAYILAEELVNTRRTMVGEEPDELLGQMLGSQGQALAFMGQIDQDWLAPAQALFKSSMEHFALGTRQADMSRNYLATSFWQSGRLADALASITDLNASQTDHIGLMSVLIERLREPHPEKRAFEIVNLLRIMAALANSGHSLPDDLNDVWLNLQSAAQSVGTDHPYEQWWKWIGILQLIKGNSQAADYCFASAEDICGKHSFTMKTIGCSIGLLKSVSAYYIADTHNAEIRWQSFSQKLEELRHSSMGFDSYISARTRALHLPLKDYAIIARPRSTEFWQLCTILPFAYS